MSEFDYRSYFLNNVEGLRKLIQIPSVFDASAVTAELPFGEKPHEALMFMKKVLEDDGFKVINYDDQAISASIGKGMERIDIASHVDVVDVADGWDKDPFSGDIDDEFIYGRGSQDMKGPGWLIYLAVKLIRDSGIKLNKEIRMVYGSDEEVMMNDMKHYLSLVEAPSFAFTPDGSFPLAIGEKGDLTWALKQKYEGIVRNMKCGYQYNVVPDVAECTVKADNIKDVLLYCLNNHINGEAEITEEGLKILIHGKAVHASTPELGHNAINDLLKLLNDVYGEKQFGELYEAFKDYHGKGSELDYDIEPMGKLTVSLGILNIENGELFGMVDSRYPYGVTSKTMTENLQKHLPSYGVELIYDDPPTLQDENDPYVLALLNAYNEVNESNEKPIISGGVSYSKVFGHCVCFGPVFPYEEKRFHKVNEKISIDSCVKALEIYHKAILNILNI